MLVFIGELQLLTSSQFCPMEFYQQIFVRRSLFHKALGYCGNKTDDSICRPLTFSASLGPGCSVMEDGRPGLSYISKHE